MNHDRELFGAYVLGVLEREEARSVEAHLAGCAECRQELAELTELQAMLGEVPPEAFLDGPPEGGDLLLQRTLRAARGPRRGPVVLAAAAVVAATALGAGVLIGQRTGEPTASPTVTVPAPSSAPVPGTRTATGTDPRTRTTMTASVIPAAGWVRVKVDVKGLPVGARCELRVLDRTGRSVGAGSWLVSKKGSLEGTKLDGAALIPIDRVQSVDILTFEGRRMISVPL